ncbi:MAG: response regulator transcription factor [Planctomycetota bacterium]
MVEVAHKISILLVDDEALVRAGMRALLEQTESFSVVGESSDARDAIERCQALQPDVVILDIKMPGLSGLDAVAPIKKVSPNTRVLVASQHESRDFVFQALRAGADGYICKASDPRELGPAIEAIERGELFVTPRVAATFLGGTRPDSGVEPVSHALAELTAREREVFQLIAVGKANKDIASVLGISLGTVKKHRENLQRKLDVHSAAEIARMAIREGLLTP